MAVEGATLPDGRGHQMGILRGRPYHRSPEEGKLNVTNGGTHEANDVVFVGDPGPDMIPLDDEAKAISASFSKKWVNPIEDLPVNMTYADRLLESLQSEVAQLQSQPKSAPASDLGELKDL